jgi:hypothetical protein
MKKQLMAFVLMCFVLIPSCMVLLPKAFAYTDYTDFETGWNGWTTDGNVSSYVRGTVYAHNGSYSVYTENESLTEFYINNTFTWSNETTYLTVWALTVDNVGESTVNCKLDYENGTQIKGWSFLANLEYLVWVEGYANLTQEVESEVGELDGKVVILYLDTETYYVGNTTNYYGLGAIDDINLTEEAPSFPSASVTVAASPEGVGSVWFTLNYEPHQTVYSENLTLGFYEFVVQNLTAGNYSFSHWTVNGTLTYENTELDITIGGNTNITIVYIYTAGISFEFSNIGHSTYYAGWQIQFWCTVKCETNELIGYIFGWNASGTWYDYDYKTFTPTYEKYINTFELGSQYLPSSFTEVVYAFRVKVDGNVWGFSGYQTLINKAPETIISGDNIGLNCPWQRNSFSKYGDNYQFFFNSTDKKVYYAVKPFNETAWVVVPNATTTACYYSAIDWGIWFDGSFVYIAWVGSGKVIYMKKGYIDGYAHRLAWHWGTETVATMDWSYIGYGYTDVCTKWVSGSTYYFVSVNFKGVTFFWKKATDTTWLNQSIFGLSAAATHAEIVPYRDGIVAFAVKGWYPCYVYYWALANNNFTYMFEPVHVPNDYTEPIAHSLTATEDGTKGYLLISCAYSFNYGYEIQLFSFEIGSSEYNVTILARNGVEQYGGVQIFIVGSRVIPMWYGGSTGYPPYVSHVVFQNYDLGLTASSQYIYVIRDSSMISSTFMIGFTDYKYMLSWMASGSNVIKCQEADWGELMPSIDIGSLEILNRSCLDSIYDTTNGTGWLIVEKQYYIFRMNLTVYGCSLHYASFKFTDVAGNDVIPYYNNVTSKAGLLSDTSFSAVNNPILVKTGSYSYSIMLSAWLKKPLIDTWYVDLYGYANDTTGDISTGWVLGRIDYFNIYSQGGLEKMTASGDAGRLDGGDFFNLYAYNNSFAMSEIYWRHLVDVKLLFSFQWEHGAPPSEFPTLWLDLGFNYFARGNWCDSQEIYVRLGLDSFAYGADWQYSKWLIQIKRGSTTIFSDYIYGWFDSEDNTFTIWLDLWFNKANASSIFGIRATSYWYAVKNSADWLHRIFTGNDWGVYYANQSSYIIFSELRDESENKLFSSEIEMIELWAKLYQYSQSYNYSGKIIRIQQFDYTFNVEMQGIPTPSFEAPRTPAMPMGGFLGVLASWLSALVNALAPAFAFMWSGVVYVLDGVLQALTGQPGVFTNFVSLISAIISSIVSFFGILASNFVNFVTVVYNTVTWFFGSFFSYIWGIVEFIFLTPAFNIITVVATIFGISIAWLAGTSYTNGFGQTYDFTNLSNLHFAGLSGGIVIFFLIFVAGFFLQILKCISTLSLGPILEPIGLFMGVVNFVIRIVEVIWYLIRGVIQLLVQIAHALRDIAPRPMGL